MSISFTERLIRRGFNFDILDEQKQYQEFLDPIEDTLMDDPVTCGEHTLDKKVLKVWIDKCLSKTKPEVTHPITGEVIAYDPDKPFEKQFPRNLTVIKMIDKFVEEFELANPLKVEVKEDEKSEIKEEKNVEEKEEKNSEIKEEKIPVVKEEKKAEIKDLESKKDIKAPYPKDFDERFDVVKPSSTAPQIKNSRYYESESQSEGYPIGFEILDRKNGIVKVDTLVMRVRPERLNEDFSPIYIEGQIAKQIPTLCWGDDFNLLQEFCTLWDLCSQEKIDTNKSDYLKFVLFKIIVHNHGIHDVFQYQNSTWFRSNLTIMELIVLIESFRTLSNVLSRNVEIQIADLEEFFRNIPNQKKSIMPFEHLFQLCKIVPLVDRNRKSSLQNWCKNVFGGIDEIFRDGVSFFEKSGNWIAYASLNVFLEKWKEFYVDRDDHGVLTHPKVELFACIVKVCAKIHETTSDAPKEFDKMMDILCDQVSDLSDIMTKNKFGVFSVVMNDEIRDKIFSMQHSPLFKKMYDAFIYNGKAFFIVDRESNAALKAELCASK